MLSRSNQPLEPRASSKVWDPIAWRRSLMESNDLTGIGWVWLDQPDWQVWIKQQWQMWAEQQGCIWIHADWQHPAQALQACQQKSCFDEKKLFWWHLPEGDLRETWHPFFSVWQRVPCQHLLVIVSDNLSSEYLLASFAGLDQLNIMSLPYVLPDWSRWWQGLVVDHNLKDSQAACQGIAECLQGKYFALENIFSAWTQMTAVQREQDKNRLLAGRHTTHQDWLKAYATSRWSICALIWRDAMIRHEESTAWLYAGWNQLYRDFIDFPRLSSAITIEELHAGLDAFWQMELRIKGVFAGSPWQPVLLWLLKVAFKK